MSEVSKTQQLIHALLDDELDQARAQEVRKQIASDGNLAKFYHDCLQQREALRGSPRFQLPKDFSDCVLQCQETALPFVKRTRGKLPVNSMDSKATPGASQASASRGWSWQIATTALVSSAVTLLLTISIWPGTSTADHRQGLSHTHTRKPEAVDRLSMGMPFTVNAEEAIPISSPIDTPVEPPIEQVWLLEAQDDQSSVELVRTLAANSIQIPGERSEGNEQILIDTLDREINGILIEASALQMKKALLELADSQQFEISAFTLPGHEAYFTDIGQSSTVGEDWPEQANKNDVREVASADQLAAEAIASVVAASQGQGELEPAPRPMAQQLRRRGFSNKNVPLSTTATSKKAVDVAVGIDGNVAVDPLSLSSAQPTSSEQSTAVAQQVEALFPDSQQIGEFKSNYLLLIRSVPR